MPYDCGYSVVERKHAMASGQKKVIVRTTKGLLERGYLPQGGMVRDFSILLMQVDGRTTPYQISDIESIAYVRDFNLDDSVDPERIGRRSFQARPRGDGLWLRVTFLGGEILEGMTSVQTELIDALIEDHGIFLTPPDTRGNTQKVFVPRAALRLVEVLGSITAPSKRLAKTPAQDDLQATLFHE